MHVTLLLLTASRPLYQENPLLAIVGPVGAGKVCIIQVLWCLFINYYTVLVF